MSRLIINNYHSKNVNQLFLFLKDKSKEIQNSSLPASDDPFGEESDEKLIAIAKQFEEKYVSAFISWSKHLMEMQ